MTSLYLFQAAERARKSKPPIFQPLPVGMREEPEAIEPSHSKPLSGGAWVVIIMMFGCVCLGFGVWLGAKADHASMCQAMQTYGVRCEGVL